MVKNIINSAVFRIFTPIFYGVTMYILILLIFDRVQDLSENFLVIEATLCVVITYLIFELIRLYILQVEKRCSANCSISRRLIIQGGGSLIITVIITSLIISFYFSKLVGFNTFRNELTVFNAIFLITSVLYNMVYFSFFYLNRTNESLLEKEAILRHSVEIELDTYKNKINPEFLYDSLETLISLSKKDVEEADKFILDLSDVYRNVLSTKNTDPVKINDEFKIINTLIKIFNYKLNNNLKFNISNKDAKPDHKIIGGTLVVIVEDIVNRTIISEIQPLIIESKVINEFLEISHPIRSKLIQNLAKETEIEHLKKAYLQNGQDFSISEAGGVRIYKIPILKIED